MSACSFFRARVMPVAVIAAAAWTLPHQPRLHAQTPYKLVWSDEFNGKAGAPPDPTRWQFEAGLGAKIAGNEEAETYCSYLSAEAPCNGSQPNVYLDGHGHLVIVAIRTDATVKLPKASSPVYTSGRIKSLRTFQYGRIEASLRVPTGQGVWPAFWVLGNSNSTLHWPATGEIDVMESWNPQPGTTTIDPVLNHASTHGPVAPGSSEGYTEVTSDYRFKHPMQEGWHQFAAEWGPGQVDFYCDGVWYGQHSLASLTDKEVWELDNVPFYFLLNLAMGGEFFGYPNESTPKLPTFVADYVRLYQRDDSLLPSGWGNVDIGGPAEAGSTQTASGVWNVNGSGAGIAGRVDQFQFAYHPLAGDGEVSAHLLDQSSKNPQAKAGIMLRDGRGSGEIYALLFVSPDGSLHFRARGNEGDVPGESPLKGTASWLKLARQGELITALISSDGKTWTPIGQARLKMQHDVLAGLISSARDNGTPNHARFDYVSVTPTDAAWDGRATHLPGTLQAEDFNSGGSGYSYSSNLKHKGHTPFRDSDGPEVRQIATQPEPHVIPGGYYLAGLRKDEYLNYSVFVEKDGEYKVTARVASAGPGGSFRINLDQKPVSHSIAIPDTGGAEKWTVVTDTLHLTAGQHTLAIVPDAVGAGGVMGNLDFLSVTAP